jgi:hypothetical protein
MTKLFVAISTLVAITTLFASTAFADVACPAGGAPPCGGLPGTGGSGCSVVATHPGALAFLMVTVGIVALAIGRRRK